MLWASSKDYAGSTSNESDLSEWTGSGMVFGFRESHFPDKRHVLLT